MKASALFRRPAAAGLVPTLSCVFCAAASAAPALPDGALDPRFGHAGQVITDFPVNDDLASALAVQPDGKIVVVGLGGDTQPPQYGLLKCRILRFDRDGRLDPAFGEGGQVRIKLPSDSGPSSCERVAVQADGKIVVAGMNDTDLVLIRLDRDGSFDRGFSGDGVQTTDLTYSETPYALAIQSDGKIVVGAKGFDDWAGTNVLLTVRYRSDGELDRGFGDGGAALAEFARYRYGAYGTGLAVQADGKIVLAGGAFGDGESASLLLRYRADGRPDPQFGDGGRVIESADGAVDNAISLALQADGKLVTGHTAYDAQGKRRGTLQRYLADGRRDPDFIGATLAVPPKRLAIQADGRIVALGNDPDDVPKPGAVARVDPDGRIDASFATGRIDFGGDDDFFMDLALQGDGRILMLAWLSDEDRTGLARLSNRTYCLADARHPGRYLGFSASGWFASADGDGSGAVGRGRAQAWRWPGLGRFARLSAAQAGRFVDASVFGADGSAWGLASVFARDDAAARYAFADARVDDPVCAVRPGP